ncbi:Chitin synthase chs-2 like protein [Argiope bruennichi]|uniref:chitin synthase n=1 Tax=Argiope bruennichi TaxID=94029 RepID=A0A8T0FUP3_ARGBR|nr:Chitin synthase chs-2 like protein [Argiope bruennichi]
MATVEESTTVKSPALEEVLRAQNENISDVESELMIVDEERKWDLYDESAVQKDRLTEDRPTFNKAVKLLKILVYLATFGIILACAVLSKATLLFMTSVIHEKNTFSPCNISGLERDQKYVVQLSKEERYSWMWCLLFVFFVPEILTFIRSARLCIFKKYQKPKLSSFILVFVVETLHIVGLTIMVFVVFPQINSIVALALTNAVCIVPSFLNVYASWNSQNTVQAWMNNILCLFVIVGQIIIVIWASMYGHEAISHEFDTNSHSATILMSCATVAAILISCAWWENFVNINSPHILQTFKNDIERSRNFIYIFISSWKIILLYFAVLICLSLSSNSDEVRIFLKTFPNCFKRHNLTLIWPNIDDTVIISDTLKPPKTLTFFNDHTEPYLPLIIAAIHMTASFLCYSCGKFVCKICIQGFSYALPVLLTVPVTMSFLNSACEHECGYKRLTKTYHYWNCPEDQSGFSIETRIFWILWLLSQVLITIHLWNPQNERMASTNKLFVNPLYCSALIDQSLALNRRRNEKVEPDGHARLDSNVSEMDGSDVPRIFACATMWHETPDEMEQLLKSIMRMDVHQCSQKTIQDGLVIRNPDYYEIETHIFFDDAFVVSDDDDDKMTINSFVKDFIAAVDTAASKVYSKKCQQPDPPIKVPTPYGGRLIWRLLGDNALVVHLKNKELIRHKKRWSQPVLISGEDRWLCTLLLQRGYRVEYSAASDAYTHCPETFGEFYTQRRRWAPSTMANIMDLLINYKKTIKCNDNISRLYIAYQVLLMIGTILGPGTIFLMLGGFLGEPQNGLLLSN